jgi:hypothetical protein
MVVAPLHYSTCPGPALSSSMEAGLAFRKHLQGDQGVVYVYTDNM